MSQISGYDLAKQFYINGKCIIESEIEKIFNNTITQICPNVIVNKTKLKNGQTDGIFKFLNDDKSLRFWTLQECKRDIGFNSIQTPRAFIQALYYLGNYYYDSLLLGTNTFKGIFLDSARYFCYISNTEIDPIMSEFEPLFNKYYRVRPSEVHIIPEVYDWAIKVFKNIKKDIHLLDDKFRFDTYILDIYENKI